MYRSLLTKRTTKGTSVLHTCIHDTLLPKQRSNDAQVHGKWCRKDRKGQEERIRGRALGNTAKLGRPWRRCKQQPTSGRTKGARFCKLEPRGDRSVAEKHASCCFQLRLHSLCSRCCLASLVVLWFPLKPLRSTDASLLSEVKRRVQERESGDTKLLPRVKAYSSERREVRNSIRVCCLSNSPKGCS